MKPVGLINVAPCRAVPCRAGLAAQPDDAGDLALEHSTSSFVEAHHRILGTKCGIYTQAHGYNRILSVVERLSHGTVAGKRDRTLLALGCAGAFRRFELVALEVADLAETPDSCG